MFEGKSIVQIGVLSDTHGLLRPQVLKALSGVDLIIHAGDIGSSDVLDTLQKMAPVTAVRGNMDRGPWAQVLSKKEVVAIEDHLLYVLHDLHDLDLDLEAAGFSGIIYGHSHQPALCNHEGVLYLNPGSAGPRRFSYPVSIARIRVTGLKVVPQIVDLDV
jgi:putative phosphoesterase